MKLNIGNMWAEEHVADVIFITTNAIINAQGKLVMGRGAALEAATRYPTLSFDLAERIRPFGKEPYHLLILPQLANGVQLGAFQVKRHWKDEASLLLIAESAMRLAALAKTCPDMRFVVNYPGIGNGRLSEGEVEPIISTLPDNVIIYKKKI